jgi:hypothetical protein
VTTSVYSMGLFFVLVLIATAAHSIAAEATDDELLPLPQGRSWDYRVSTETWSTKPRTKEPPQKSQRKVTVTVTGAHQISITDGDKQRVVRIESEARPITSPSDSPQTGTFFEQSRIALPAKEGGAWSTAWTPLEYFSSWKFYMGGETSDQRGYTREIHFSPGIGLVTETLSVRDPSAQRVSRVTWELVGITPSPLGPERDLAMLVKSASTLSAEVFGPTGSGQRETYVLSISVDGISRLDQPQELPETFRRLHPESLVCAARHQYPIAKSTELRACAVVCRITNGPSGCGASDTIAVHLSHRDRPPSIRIICFRRNAAGALVVVKEESREQALDLLKPCTCRCAICLAQHP